MIQHNETTDTLTANRDELKSLIDEAVTRRDNELPNFDLAGRATAGEQAFMLSLFFTKPANTISLATEPQYVTRCGCTATDSTTEDHYALRTSLSEMSQAALNALVEFLLQYKQATYHEAMHLLFGSGSFTNAELTLLNIENKDGTSAILFRLAATITDVI